MTLFDEREHAFEAKFAHDAEMMFRAEARRNRLLGLWAAELIGRKGEAAEAYAREIIKTEFHEAGDQDVFRRLKEDLGHLLGDAEIRAKMVELKAVAKAQLLEEI